MDLQAAVLLSYFDLLEASANFVYGTIHQRS
jgi:hypothetical protein